ncbi:hypothetical protein HDU96_010364 [Phlyctochytrium bullatum]|nr:hypothetical protein HDU96_010364 [Phlyctochytrium bullatum]
MDDPIATAPSAATTARLKKKIKKLKVKQTTTAAAVAVTKKVEEVVRIDDIMEDLVGKQVEEALQQIECEAVDPPPPLPTPPVPATEELAMQAGSAGGAGGEAAKEGGAGEYFDAEELEVESGDVAMAMEGEPMEERSSDSSEEVEEGEDVEEEGEMADGLPRFQPTPEASESGGSPSPPSEQWDPPETLTEDVQMYDPIGGTRNPPADPLSIDTYPDLSGVHDTNNAVDRSFFRERPPQRAMQPYERPAGWEVARPGFARGQYRGFRNHNGFQNGRRSGNGGRWGRQFFRNDGWRPHERFQQQGWGGNGNGSQFDGRAWVERDEFEGGYVGDQQGFGGGPMGGRGGQAPPPHHPGRMAVNGRPGPGGSFNGVPSQSHGPGQAVPDPPPPPRPTPIPAPTRSTEAPIPVSSTAPAPPPAAPTALVRPPKRVVTAAVMYAAFAAMPLALHHAASQNDASTVRGLIAAGADPAARDARGRLAVECSLAFDVWRAFARRMPVPDEKDVGAVVAKGDGAALRLLIGGGADVGGVGEDGMTCLHVAAREGHEDVMRVLLSHEPAKQLIERQAASWSTLRNVTPLHIAASQGHLPVARLLVESSEAGLEAPDRTHTTPLLAAALHGRADVAAYLLDRGANLRATTAAGDTALHLAAYSGHEALVRSLAARGADVDARSGAGYAAVHVAAWRGHARVCVALLEVGADGEAASRVGKMRALHVAAMHGQAGVCGVLAGRVEVDARDAAGETALVLAAGRGHAAVVGVLLKKGAKKEIANAKGLTALAVAREKGMEMVVQLLTKGEC